MKNKKLKKLSNLKLRTRSKVLIPIIVVLIAFILLCSAIPIADITYKYGNDGSNNWFGPVGVITNSNDKCWEATGSNIQTAIDDLSGGGKVTLPAGYFDISSNLSLSNCVLEGQGAGGLNEMVTQINLTANSTIILEKGGALHGIFVYAPQGHGSVAVRVNGSSDNWGYTDILDNIVIKRYNGVATNGTGLQIYCSDTAIALCSFSNVFVRGFEKSVHLYATETGTAYITDLHFNSFHLSDGKYLLTLESIGTADVDGCQFNMLNLEPGASTVDGIRLIGDCNYHSFQGIMADAWGVASGYVVNISASSGQNYIQGYLHVGDYLDSGDENTIVCSAILDIAQYLRLREKTSAPGTPAEGDIYYHTTDNKFYGYTGFWWHCLSFVQVICCKGPSTTTVGL